MKTKNKNNILNLIENDLNKLGFSKDINTDNKSTIVKFTKNEDKKCSITINLDTKLTNTMLWSSKLTLRQEVTVLNVLLTNLIKKTAKEELNNESNAY